ncbi:uncharacterized protein JCM10292_000416 [Rhodotorula paludigena]|uniref:uncharacterized protein n=1 Tax=Rhodotorula paludigena TaxID=86838 RepID=UPI00316BBACF
MSIPFLRLPPAPSSSSSRSSTPTPHKPAAVGRLRKGAQLSSAHIELSDPFAPVRPFQEFEETDSPSAVQDYVAALVRRDPHDVEEVIQIPLGRDDDGEEYPLVDEGVWVYEQLRRLTIDQHPWIASLLPLCTPLSCPTMTTSPLWAFVCAAHADPQPDPPCSAIDYIVHTSEGAQALLTSARYFPSRLGVDERGRRLLSAVARRLYRSFAHAYYHHHDLFVALESETSLVRRFGALNRRFALVEEEMLVIPELEELGLDNEGEGGERDEDDESGGIRAVEQTKRASGEPTTP